MNIDIDEDKVEDGEEHQSTNFANIDINNTRLVNMILLKNNIYNILGF